MTERIVYVSRAAPGIAARDAYDIIRVSHNRNSKLGLTGALIFLDGHFLQVLEGDRFRVRERLAAISADPRHSGLELRQTAAAPVRAFADDWMALRLGDGISEATRQAFGYVPGFPPERFNADQLVAFAQACCRDHAVGQAATA